MISTPMDERSVISLNPQRFSDLPTALLILRVKSVRLYEKPVLINFALSILPTILLNVLLLLFQFQSDVEGLISSGKLMLLGKLSP